MSLRAHVLRRSRPVSARALGMREAALGGWPGNGLPPRAGHAVVHEGRNLRAVNLAAITTTTNQRLGPTPSAQKQPRRSECRCHGRIGRRHVDERPAFRNIDRRCVPGTVWGTASNRTAKSRSTPCLSLRRPSLPQHPPRRQDAITRHRITSATHHHRLGKPKKASKLTTAPSMRGFSPPSTPSTIIGRAPLVEGSPSSVLRRAAGVKVRGPRSRHGRCR